MAEATVTVTVETRHGDDCTCPSVGEVNISLVASRPDCPGDHSPHRAGSIDAQLAPYRPVLNGTHAEDITSEPGTAWRVVLTFPVAEPGKPVAALGTIIRDYDTGEQIVDATCLRLVVGDDEGWSTNPLTVELTRLVDAEGNPIGAGRQPVMTDEYREHMQREREQQTDLPFDGPKFLTGRFRYLVVWPAEQ